MATFRKSYVHPMLTNQRDISLFSKTFQTPLKSSKIVQSDMIGFLKFLSFFGYSPLDYQQLKMNKYQFYRPNFLSALSTAMCLFDILCWIIFLLSYSGRIAIFIDRRFIYFVEQMESRLIASGLQEQSAKTINQCLITAYTAIPLFQLSSIIFEWLTVNYLVLFLKRWDIFETKYYYIFPFMRYIYNKSDQVKVSKAKSILLIFFPLIGITFFVSGLGQMMTAGPYSLQTFVLSFNVIFVFATGVDMFAISPFADIKAAKLCQLVKRAYELVHEGITYSLELQTLRDSTVQDWRTLIIMIRDQTEVLSDHLKITQLLFILQCIILSTLSSFIGLNYKWTDGLQRTSGIIWIGLSLALLLRLQYKATAAEGILTWEGLILASLTKIDETLLDTETKIQLQITKHLMENQPNQLRFSRTLAFRKRVVLSILNLVVTYVIVLQQSTGT